MTGFHTLAASRPNFDYGRARVKLPPPVVPMERCRPAPPPPPPPAPKPVIMIPEHIPAPIERQVVRAPLGLSPVAPTLGTHEGKVPPLAPIVALVADVTGIPVDHIKGPSRKLNVAKARMIAAFIGRRFTGRSTPQIGKALGNRDHTTVLHAIRRAESLFAGKPRPDEDTPEAWAEYLWAIETPHGNVK